jgi:RNA polymerase sigma-70 factor (ECF subfamily)
LDYDVLSPVLLRRVCARDPEALEQFFDAYYDRVFGYVVRMVGRRDRAEDIAHDVFVRLHRVIDRIDPERDPAPWVFKVVANAVRDHWRSRQHRDSAREMPFDEAWDQAEETPSAQDSLERQADAEDIHVAMAQLSPADREIILLRDFQELDTVEISELLDIQSDAVRQRHSRALKRRGKIYREQRGEGS